MAIPIPWVDLNNYIELVLPGSSFGIGTDLVTLAAGFILPLNVIVSILAGSVALYVIGNPIMLKMGVWRQWLPGMSVADCLTQSVLHIWAPFIIGASIAAALLPLARRPGLLVRTFKSMRKVGFRQTEPGEIPPVLSLIMFFASTALLCAFQIMLAPRFPF